jgi:hypothetical protein
VPQFQSPGGGSAGLRLESVLIGGLPAMNITITDEMASLNHLDDWIVIGWYTPDYRPYAVSLASQLDAYQTPYHFFGIAKPEGHSWEELTRMKPEVVLRAMDRHPGKTLVLFDIDVTVLKPIAEMRHIRGDVSFYMSVRNPRGNRIKFSCSSRAMVVRPTPECRYFMQAWRDRCATIRRYAFDETVLMLILARSSYISFSPLPEIYSARDRNTAPAGAAVVHESASASSFKMSGLLRKLRIY